MVNTKKIKELPPLSNSAQEVLKIVQNDDIDVSVFTKVVEHDPALLAKLIGLANSAYFGSRSVTNVHRAVVDVLGFRTAKNIALGVVLGGIFNPKQCQHFDLPRYWFISLLTATLSREFVLSIRETIIDANEAYLSGMLNEIGLMALAYLYPQEMDQILSQEDNEVGILSGEADLIGNNHYSFSAELLESWHLPRIVSQIMCQSVPDSGREACDLCKIIHFSQRIARHVYEQSTLELDELQMPVILAGQTEVVEKIITKATTQVDSYREMAKLLS